MPFATDITDVRIQSNSDENAGGADNGVAAAIISGLSKPAHQRTLPTLLLYTEIGLRIYDELTAKVTEYYLFGAEEEILKKHGDEIIRAMHTRGYTEGESVVELGAGYVISFSPLPPPISPSYLVPRISRRSLLSRALDGLFTYIWVQIIFHAHE
jgi:hypothetical protein